MKDTNDVSKLFEEIGGSAKAYREINRAERAGEALARWPLLSSLQEDIAKSGSPEDASLLNIPLGRRQEPQLPRVVREDGAAARLAEAPLAEMTSPVATRPSPLGAWAAPETEPQPGLRQAVWAAEPELRQQPASVLAAASEPVAQEVEPDARAAGFSLAAKLALRQEEAVTAPVKAGAPARPQGNGLQDVFSRILGDVDNGMGAATRSEPALPAAFLNAAGPVSQGDGLRNVFQREPQASRNDSDDAQPQGQASFSLAQRLNRL
ncbi:cellulose biosynthesis protein BcsP [Pseudomonas sp. S 311-6]|uniref:Cellulose biosynthesis protein BcsR n=3 Tax=Kerstersia gyiorum TaxID=206506 RepID=A0A171KPM7_9BURK|nr:cellulose biosynthesis protein BcsP [Kerstersia gyiorum]MCO7636777.1 cellulose biosynthesis protein BcsP [Pseudomonas sp. S 311-6]KKO70844.1 hypothetical protein AAV32_13940 [Kerstersia gyiorum]MCP1631813.1 hypothetical protein [Kerstersia gyiorum]MCP1681466.1 hypothetical protein [Kerstersia gyiorum]MCP1712023.1 hypothetical protein [Kerstersia gyiorum]